MIAIPRTGIFAVDPNGIWYLANGILSNRSTGITNIHIITCIDNITSHKV
jgi:hypothetical protein